ncbi:MAG TPA: ankyrin repeat domain-containing protein [Stellaceae bacterium]|jgi:ankyrin repeat-rich membrane spanning protein
MVSRGAWFLAAVLGVGVAEAVLPRAARAQADMNDLLILPRAAERNDFDAVLNMLQRGDTTDTEGEDRRAALSFAAANGNMQIMNLLLDHLADVEHRDRFGDTALHWAALNGQTEAVKRLLAANAGINDQNGQGVTALMMAVSNNRREVVRILVDAGADLQIEDFTGHDANAMARGKPSILAILEKGKR